jgi:DNA ligase (NAD+)
VEKNELGNTTWRMPETCPSCGTFLIRHGAHQFCENPKCSDQIRGRVRFFVGRNQMDIDNLGPETLDVLIERDIIRDVEDLYTFDPDALLDLPGFGEKKVRLIREGLEKSKRRGYRNVLVSLGIPEIGQKVAELLVESGFRDIDRLLGAAEKKDTALFTGIHGIGEKIAQTLIEELNRDDVRRRIEGLKKSGLRFSEETPEEQENLPQTFSGQTWCVTGSFESFKPRESAMEEVKRRGGRVTSGVTSKTTHLLAGPGAGSKLDKARKLGVIVVEEADFLKLLASP